MYGLTETIATRKALESVRNKRSLVISRSTFPSQGAHGGHWTGDNKAAWDDLALSIPSILSFNMFGIPLVGADICGFQWDTNEELCARWIELGAFYPFSRDHNTIGAIPQELYRFHWPPLFPLLSRWQSVAEIGKTVLSWRYQLLSYMYTLFFDAAMNVCNYLYSSYSAG